MSTLAHKIECECGSVFQLTEIQYNDVESGMLGALVCKYCDSHLLPRKGCKVDAKFFVTHGQYHDHAWTQPIQFITIMEIPDGEELRNSLTVWLEGRKLYDLSTRLSTANEHTMKLCFLTPVEQLDGILKLAGI